MTTFIPIYIAYICVLMPFLSLPPSPSSPSPPPSPPPSPSLSFSPSSSPSRLFYTVQLQASNEFDHVCRQGGACAEVRWGLLCSARILTSADVCWRMLTYADVCWRMQARWCTRRLMMRTALLVRTTLPDDVSIRQHTSSEVSTCRRMMTTALFVRTKRLGWRPHSSILERRPNPWY